MPGKWVIGALANNLWSFAGDSDRENVNLMTVQPFVNYNFGKGWYVYIVADHHRQLGRPTAATTPGRCRWAAASAASSGSASCRSTSNAQAFDNVVKPDDDPTADWTLRLPGRVPVPEMRRQ